jgi:hypothetical protein
MIAAILPLRRRLNWLSLALGVGSAVHGCAAAEPDPTAGSRGAAPRAEARVPPGAIQIGDQLYQVPIGADDDGCARYRLYSPAKLVAQAIYYRDPAGGFTPDRRRAACAGAPAEPKPITP